jgi:hypothetical protein
VIRPSKSVRVSQKENKLTMKNSTLMNWAVGLGCVCSQGLALPANALTVKLADPSFLGELPRQDSSQRVKDFISHPEQRHTSSHFRDGSFNRGRDEQPRLHNSVFEAASVGHAQRNPNATRPSNVPDGGSSVAFLGLGLASLGLTYRQAAKSRVPRPI